MLDPENYTIKAVLNRVRSFVYDELYVPAFNNFPQKPSLGFIVEVILRNAPLADEFQIDIQNGTDAVTVHTYCVGAKSGV